MKKFIVLYRAPATVLENWNKIDPDERQKAEDKMRDEWKTWATTHTAAHIETAGAGKTKHITKEGVTDSKNDIMLYSLVQAESHEAAAQMFEGHPHFGIPETSIEVMEANVLPGMKLGEA